MKIPFRQHHLINLLESYEQQTLPLDIFMSLYFRDHTSLGSKDRGEIAEAVYGITRWMGLLTYLSETRTPSWEELYHLYQTFDPTAYAEVEGIPLFTRYSFPEELFALIEKSHGESATRELCRVSNAPAPTTVRINPLKTTREEMHARWREHYSISLCKYSPLGIIFHRKTNFFALEEFKQGLFEVQDEGSQLVAFKVQAQPGQLVLDYCAGSGGKTLAFAHQMQHKGQIYLHDIRSRALDQARTRLRRAGIQNAQVILPDAPHLKKLKKQMDWVLADVPCSGSGTLRRNPDMKWKFTGESLRRLVAEQRVIFERALSYLAPKGHIVYATCSLFNEENQEQLEHFLRVYSLEVVGEPFVSLPTEGGMDGFFAVEMKRSTTNERQSDG